jgi:GlpG protein
MRELGTLPDADSARTLADFLQGRSIETRLDESPQGWVLWVLDEDKLAQARQEYEQFLSNPSDPRYRQASRPSPAAPKETAPREGPPRKARPAELWRLAPQSQLTISLIVCSILVTLFFWSPPQRAFVGRVLFITGLIIDEKGYQWLRPPPHLPEVRQGEVWRLVTPMFVHFDIPHLLFNMLWLYMLGSQIESRCGTGRFALLAILLAIASNTCQYYFSELSVGSGGIQVTQSSPVFGGMSGVVFGLFGYVWMKTVYEPTCGFTLGRGSVLLMLVWFCLCLSGAVGHIANMAHFVGLLLGIVSGYVSAWLNGWGQRE